MKTSDVVRNKKWTEQEEHEQEQEMNTILWRQVKPGTWMMIMQSWINLGKKSQKKENVTRGVLSRDHIFPRESSL